MSFFKETAEATLPILLRAHVPVAQNQRETGRIYRDILVSSRKPCMVTHENSECPRLFPPQLCLEPLRSAGQLATRKLDMDDPPVTLRRS
jgi:hypothetical protein